MLGHEAVTIFSQSLLVACALLLFGCADDGEPQTAPPHWEISAQYIASTMMLSDDALKDAVAGGQFVPATSDMLAQAVLIRFNAMAGRMGLRRRPGIYLDTADNRHIPQAAARFTREGKAYILINAAAREYWSGPQLTAVLGHELVHLRERHVTAEALAEAYNHPDISVGHELLADRIGSSALGSCDPESLKEAIEIVIASDRQDYLSKNPFKTPGDYNDLPVGDHPKWETRKAALDAMAASPPEDCRAGF